MGDDLYGAHQYWDCKVNIGHALAGLDVVLTLLCHMQVSGCAKCTQRQNLISFTTRGLKKHVSVRAELDRQAPQSPGPAQLAAEARTPRGRGVESPMRRGRGAESPMSARASPALSYLPSTPLNPLEGRNFSVLQVR
jgi:hypothetical protein